MRRRRKSRRKSAIVKGGYRLPDGGVMTPATVTHTDNGRTIRIRGMRRDDAEAAKALAKVLLDIARRDRDG